MKQEGQSVTTTSAHKPIIVSKKTTGATSHSITNRPTAHHTVGGGVAKPHIPKRSGSTKRYSKK